MIRSFRSWERGNTVLFAGVIVLGAIAWFCLPAILAGHAPGTGQAMAGFADMARMIWYELQLVLAVGLIAWIIGDPKRLHLTSAPNWAAFWWTIPILAYLGLFLLVGLLNLSKASPEAYDILARLLPTVLFTTFLVGVFEEILFRGVVFRALNIRFGAITALVTSSLVFGAMHYVNWIEGAPLTSTHVQVLHAAAAGLLYCAVMLITNSIWSSVVLHGAWDCIVTFNQTVQGFVEVTQTTEASDPSFTSALVYGFEPVYGVVLFVFWYKVYRQPHAVPSV